MSDSLAITNSSPVILLGKIGQLGLLHLIAAEVILPQVVWEEIAAYPGASEIRDLAQLPWLRIEPTVEIPLVIARWNLGAGESAVLAAALAHPRSVAIIDDLSARRCARALGIPIKGTLGILIEAKREGALEEVRPALERLRLAGMYLDDGLVSEVLKLAGE